MKNTWITPPINNPPFCRCDLHQGTFWYDPPTEKKPDGRILCITKRFWASNNEPSLELSIINHQKHEIIEVTQASFLGLASTQKIFLIEDLTILKSFLLQ